ncbi:acyl-protein synthetase [Lysobacter sp. HDW10]|uniref:LuxE/PaaK family acyltransferase n=1 Tax=Lysobacter sp. HDW10 TaxID=2714936 RepID=UPI001407C435|nr:acyl-protein synthetase [Lysobacter sp. HDW10]QIK80421.1 acyl-protein synthetase [Lysobacter sp. HDW10]
MSATKQGVFDEPRTTKQNRLNVTLLELTRHHADNCSEYGRILNSLWPHWAKSTCVEDLPWIPVRLFKQLSLMSVQPTEIVKTLRSSGTTGQAVSRIFLDAETARAQTVALSKIFGEFVGNKRMPMLILDNDGFLNDRTKFNARAAAILGFSIFGRDAKYALDENLQPRWDEINEWLNKYKDTPIFVFGFTFIVWKHFIQALSAKGLQLNLAKDSVLLHGGGWKRMIEESVNNAEFKRMIAATTGIERVHNYYGMVEQVGSIFFECSCGFLHAPSYADVVIRDELTLGALPIGAQGVIQVVSTLPRSYPGHSLLTEDVGTLLGEDDCNCGRKGKYFEVRGRLKNVEVRGCSDTRPMVTT